MLLDLRRHAIDTATNHPVEQLFGRIREHISWNLCTWCEVRRISVPCLLHLQVTSVSTPFFCVYTKFSVKKAEVAIINSTILTIVVAALPGSMENSSASTWCGGQFVSRRRSSGLHTWRIPARGHSGDRAPESLSLPFVSQMICKAR